MAVIYARVDVTNAVIEAVLTALTLFIGTILQWIVLEFKASQVLKTGWTFISEADMRDTVKIPFEPIFAKRFLTAREFLSAVLATILLVSNSTILLGTTQTRCPFDASKYGRRTELRKTLCYEERPVATSGEAYAPLVARFLQLIDEEPNVPLKQHPRNFDIDKDEIIGDGALLPEEIWGTVESIETCEHVITYEVTDDGSSIGASEELLSLESGGSKPGPTTSEHRWSPFGYLRDRDQRLTALSYFKEVSVNNKTLAFMVTALIDEEDGANVKLENASCIKITYEGQGLKVLPFANTAVQLMKTDGDMLRIAEVAWLGATLAEQIPRQNDCERANFEMAQCVEVSLNTVITLGVAAGFAAVLAVVAIFLALLNRRNPMRNNFTQFRLLLTAISKQPSDSNAEIKSATRVKLSLARNEDGSGSVHFDVL